MTLAQMFTNNYKYLNTVAKRITSRRSVSEAPDLINETYLNLFEKKTQFPIDNEEFVKFFSKCMKNYYVWPNSSFNRIRNLDVNVMERDANYSNERYATLTGNYYGTRTEDNFRGELDSSPNGMEGIVDEDALHDIEIQVEGTNSFTKELIEISSNLGKFKTLKYIQLVEFKRILPDHELILFELYFEKELSTREIAKQYTDKEHYINYQTINKMINSIKTKIDNYTWK